MGALSRVLRAVGPVLVIKAWPQALLFVFESFWATKHDTVDRKSAGSSCIMDNQCAAGGRYGGPGHRISNYGWRRSGSLSPMTTFPAHKVYK